MSNGITIEVFTNTGNNYPPVQVVQVEENEQPIIVETPQYFAPVQSVNGKIGFVTITQADIGLTGVATSGDLNSYYLKSNPSGYITGVDTSSLYPRSNPSGYITGVDTSSLYPRNNPSGYITGIDTSNFYTKDNPSGFITSENVIYTSGDQAISGQKNFAVRPTVSNTGVLLSGQNSFIINLFNTSDTQNAGHNYFGNIAASFSTTAGGVNRRFPVLESCVVRKASWTNFNQTAGNPIQNCTGYFINTTTNTTGIISTIINTPSINLPTHYTVEFSPPITISSGDFIVCSLFGPTYATTSPATVRNSVNLYCYN